MKRSMTVRIILTVFLQSQIVWAKTDRSDEIKRIQSAASVMHEIMAAPDKAIPEDILSSAKCIAVVPSMIKGGFIVGGNYGKGIAACRTNSGWSAPAPFIMGGGTFGFQIGGEAVDLIMLVMNEQGMRQLLSSKFKLGADVSVAAGPVGRHTEGDTDWKMHAEVLSYSRARGIFAGISLDGAIIKQDTDDTLALYGYSTPFKAILSGEVAVPDGSQSFLEAVKKYATQAKRDETTEKKTGSATQSVAHDYAAETHIGTANKRNLIKKDLYNPAGLEERGIRFSVPNQNME